MSAIASVVIALAGAALLLPATVGAQQAAEDEYNLALPNSGGGNADGRGGGQAGSGPEAGASSSDGGAPVALIALAVVAAAGTGFAVWRLRQRPDADGRSTVPGRAETASETR